MGLGRDRERRGWWVVVVVMVCVALVAAGVYAVTRSRADTAPPVAGQGGDIGAGVTVTGSGLPPGLSARTVELEDPYPAPSLAVTGPMFELSPSGPLGTTATLTLPAGAPPGPGHEPMIITAESADGPWEMLPTTYDATSETVSAPVTHFSFAILKWLKVDSIVRELGGILGGLLSDPAGPGRRADCSRSGDPQQRYVLGAATSGALSVCLGLSQGLPAATVVNMRRYPLVVDPGSAAVRYQPSTQSKLGNLALGGRLFALEAGGTAILEVDGGTSIRTEIDFTANFFYTAWTAASALATLLAAAASAPVVAVATVMGLALGLADCKDTGRNGASDAGAILRECFGDPKLLEKAFGPAGFLVGLMLQMGKVITFFASQLSIGVDMVRREDQFRVDVTVAATPNGLVATETGFGSVRLGMTRAEATAAAGGDLRSEDALAHCVALTYRTSGGDAVAYVHDESNRVITIQTPAGTKTDRGVGDGSTVADLRAAYGQDHAVGVEETQAGPNAFMLSNRIPDAGGTAMPGSWGFVLAGDTVGPPMIGGLPGVEYCSG